MTSPTAQALTGFIAWTLALLLLMEVIRSWLVSSGQVKAIAIAVDIPGRRIDRIVFVVLAVGIDAVAGLLNARIYFSVLIVAVTFRNGVAVLIGIRRDATAREIDGKRWRVGRITLNGEHRITHRRVDWTEAQADT